MNPRTTGILLLIAAGLGAFVYFYEIRGEEGRLEAEAQEKRLFPGVEAEAIEWLALTSSDGQRVRAERSEKGWQMVEPLRFPGDAFALDGMASALAEIASEAVYEDPGSREVYGLDDESREVRFAAGGAEHALRTGDKTPMGGNTYACVVGEQPVYAVPSFRVSTLRKAFDDLRDKRVLRFDTSAVERISASWPDGRVELAREQGEWRLTAPLEGPADADTVKDLLSDLSFLRADGFEDEPPPDAETGLDRPAFAVELALAPAGEAEEGGEPRSLALAVGSEVDDGVRLARAGQPSLYRIPAGRIDDFPRELVEYRFKQLAEFEVDDVERVELGFSTEEGETAVITATRQEGDWKSSPEPMEPEKIARLVEELSHLEASDILAERAGVDELRELELSPAKVTLVVYGLQEGEEVRLAEVRLGALRGSHGIVAQTGETPTLFQIDLGVAEHIPANWEAFRNRFLSEPEEAVEAAPSEPSVDESP